MQPVHTVGIISKPGVPQGSDIVPPLLEWLKGKGLEVRYDFETAAYANLHDGLPRNETPNGAQLVIVLGGDGTLLSAARAIAGREIPLLAVNLGGLGFLTAITIEEVYPELERAFRGEYRLAPRRMLRCELYRGDHKLHEYEALNDVVLNKAALARMIVIDTYVDNHFVCAYRADGLIVSTPTGSTAYSLSAGGPIIFPKVSALCITPICPHMLTNRPVIVPDVSTIQIIARGTEEDCYLTIDGQVGGPITSGDRVICRSSAFSLHLIRPPKMLFFDVLRAKLNWGVR